MIRHWMQRTGKQHLLDFSDAELKKLKEYFLNLDDDRSGSIGADELTNPLIGLGFADNKEEVEQLVKLVDFDGSGQIEFDEFLLILKSTEMEEKTAKIAKFFKDLSNGVLDTSDRSFTMIVSAIRRQYMMAAIIKGDPSRYAQGKKILENVKTIMNFQLGNKKEDN